VDSAVEFITNRRGAVGAQARTRVAEAQRWSMPGSGGYGGSAVIGGGGLAGAVPGGILLDGMLGGAPPGGRGDAGLRRRQRRQREHTPRPVRGPSTWTRNLSTTQ
jgi:hypothetical protein